MKENLDGKAHPHMEDINKVIIHPDYSDNKIQIGAKLDGELHSSLRRTIVASTGPTKI